MSSGKLRVVFDCNIYWRAFFYSKGLGCECKKLIDKGKILHFLSGEIVAEVTEVLARPSTLEKFPTARVEGVHRFVKEMLARSIFVANVPSRVELPLDTKDEPYLNLAVEVNADYIVTTDNDLLDFMTGGDLDSKHFRQRFRPLRVVTPREFLDIVVSRELLLKP